MFPLAMAHTGEKWIIRKINIEQETKKRFQELGFCEGTQILVTQAEHGNLIIKNKDSSYAIDKDFAQHIFVS